MNQIRCLTRDSNEYVVVETVTQKKQIHKCVYILCLFLVRFSKFKVLKKLERGVRALLAHWFIIIILIYCDI